MHLEPDFLCRDLPFRKKILIPVRLDSQAMLLTWANSTWTDLEILKLFNWMRKSINKVFQSDKCPPSMHNSS